MITPALLRALSLDEPGAGIPHAGISEGPVGHRRSLMATPPAHDPIRRWIYLS